MSDTAVPPHILHVDMDAFFAAAEVLARPDLEGLPVVVGGTGARGVVASCTYEARAFGVRSAMPMGQARRLCPQAVVLPGRYEVYSELSRRLHAILESFTPLVEGISLDEAFMDVGGGRRLFGSAEEIALMVRAKVAEELKMSCSVGVATRKFLAKLASEEAKPRASMRGPIPGPGVVVVPPGRELSFLHPLPVTRLWGVGPATFSRLQQMGVSTVGDLAAVPIQALLSGLGKASGGHLHELAWGRDPRRVEPVTEAKSIGHEETYGEDLHHRGDVEQQLVRLADAVASRLRAGGVAGRTVTLKVRYGDFSTITRSQTLAEPGDSGPVIAKVVTGLLGSVDVGRGIRLLGVSCSGLVSQRDEEQLSLVADRDWSGASAAVDAVRARFGTGSVSPASLARPGGLHVKQAGDSQWGPSPRVEDRPVVREDV